MMARTRQHPVILLIVAAVAVVASILTSICLGSIPVALPDTISALTSAGHGPSTLASTIVWDLRLPRVLGAALVGAMLAVAGAALQAAVRNPLADPFVIGASSGATLAAVTCTTTVLGASAIAAGAVGPAFGLAAATFAGAFGALALVLAFSAQGGRVTSTRVVLAGVAVGQIAMALTTLIQLHAAPAELRGVLFWMYGSVSGATLHTLAIPAAIGAIITVLLVGSSARLDALSLGDDDAIALGVSPTRWRITIVIAVACLVGLSVIIAGGVGFIGLMVPHLARMLIGASHRPMIALSALIGAAALPVVDLAARSIDPPNEYPLSIFTAIVGAPFLLWVMRTSSGREL